MKIKEVTSIATNRRNFLKGAGLTGAGLLTATALGRQFGSNVQRVEAATYSDADVLNFALNLEYLEAEFYLMSTYGTTLVGLGVISKEDETGPTTGGGMVPDFGASPAAALGTALRTDEVNHVKFLRSALGADAVKKPAINLDALGYGYSSVPSWLELARQFEDVGASAYLGAGPYLSSITNLEAAGAILTVEGFHAGAIRLVCIQYGIMSPAVDSIDVAPTASTPLAVNSNSLAIPRTPAEVLNVVYHGGKSFGGFYPDGMNGAITAQ